MWGLAENILQSQRLGVVEVAAFLALVSSGSSPSDELLVWFLSLCSERERVPGFLLSFFLGYFTAWTNCLGIRGQSHLRFPVPLESTL